MAQAEFADFWQSLNLSRDPFLVRDAVLGFMPELVTAYGDTAAVLGADWYDVLRDAPASARSFQAVMAPPPAVEQSQGAVRWGVGPLFTDDPDPALERLLGATQRLVLQSGRNSVYSSAFSDPVVTGVARVPSGADTCNFCIMLASRGPVYKSEINAELVVGRGSNRTGYDSLGRRLSGGIGGGVKARGNQDIGSLFHDNCDCVPTVVRGPADYPAGYDPDRYKQMFREGAGTGRYAPADN